MGDYDEKLEEEDKDSPLNKCRKKLKQPFCNNWNKGVCHSLSCSFRHICIECHGTKNQTALTSAERLQLHRKSSRKPTSNALVGFAVNTPTRARTSHYRDSYISESTQKYSRTGYATNSVMQADQSYSSLQVLYSDNNRVALPHNTYAHPKQHIPLHITICCYPQRRHHP